MPASSTYQKVESVFDLRPGDRVAHGANFGRVLNESTHGPEIKWDDGRIDYWYSPYMHQIHPLRLVIERTDEH